MAREHWQRIGEVFAAARDQPAGERAAYVRAACGDQAALAAEVMTLLAAGDHAEGFLDRPVARFDVAAPRVGERVGPYRLDDVIGQGGMGIVYRASRDDGQFRQAVAIKVVRHAGSPAAAARFRTERQVLAELVHPNIARLLDGGTTEDGLPYLVMELLDGEPIDTFADRHRRTVDERLDLFLGVARAVAHAHQHLLVHRDLKPSNILVTSDGSPKLLDFGIAKLLDPASAGAEAAAEAGQTATDVRPMTPSHASPEQVRGEAVTTGTDVYGLGVLLHELLVGEPPFMAAGRPAHEVARAICEHDPPAPSSRLAALDPPDLASVSAARGTTPRELVRAVRGDLDAVVLAALRKSPSDRYGSAGALIDDIGRHRRGEPVRARAGGWRYRTGRFIRRHRLAVGVATAFVSFLAVLVGVLAVASERVARERDQVTVERDTARETLDFLTATFGTADPSYSGEVPSARQVLDSGAERVRAELADQPLVQAALLDAIGDAYSGLWVLDRALACFEDAWRLRTEHLGPDHLDTAASEAHLAWVLRESARFDAAAPRYEHALGVYRAAFGDDDVRTARIDRDHGRLLADRGDLGPARLAYERALAVFRRTLEPDDQEIITTLSLLANLHDNAGRADEAERLHRATLALQRERYGDRHSEVAISLANLGHLAQVRGRLDVAERDIREALSILQAIFDDDHVLVHSTLHNLAAVEHRRGKVQAARDRYERVVALRERAVGDHPALAATLKNLGGLLAEAGELDLAGAHLRRALAIYTEAYGEAHRRTASSRCQLGEVARLRGDLDQAEAHASACLEALESVAGEGSRFLVGPLLLAGRIALDRDDPASAESALRRGSAIGREHLAPNAWRLAEIRGELGLALAALGRNEEAEPMLRARFDTYAAQFSTGDARLTAAADDLARFYRDTGRPDDAEHVLAGRESLATGR